MPAPRQPQSNAMLITAIVFVALFILSTVFAVIYYLKAEDLRIEVDDEKTQRKLLASNKEASNLSNLIGAEDKKASRVKQMVNYYDELYQLFTGLVPEETSIEVKAGRARGKFSDVTSALDERVTANNDAVESGALRVIELLNDEQKAALDSLVSTTMQLVELQTEYALSRESALAKEKDLQEQLKQTRAMADEVQRSYNDLKEQMNKKSDEVVRDLMSKMEKANEESKAKSQQLRAALANLKRTEDRMQHFQAQLEAIKPRPGQDIIAYKADAEILSVETTSKTVFLNIGIRDKVYNGLTFSVFDKSAPIPPDGRGKAKIEIYDVKDTVSVARITESSIKNPIIPGDIIVNMVWDSTARNKFVVAGNFDGDDRGTYGGKAKIKQLIEAWGGEVEDEVTIDTAFVVLGMPPQVLRKPTMDEVETDPMLPEKYEMSLIEAADYKNVKQQANELDIPIFNKDRFLQFIGR